MRNAIILSGHLRCSFNFINEHETVADKFNEYINQYNCDIFLITSYNNYIRKINGEVIKNVYTIENIKKLPYYNKVVDLLITENIKNLENKVNKYFNISKHNIYKNIKEKNIEDYDRWSITNSIVDDKVKDTVTNQYYRRKIGLKMLKKYEKKNNIKYDNIIITRPDLLILEPIKLNELVENYIYGAGYISNNDCNFSEQFIYGKANTIKKLFKNFLKDYGNYYGYYGYRPEKIIAYYIKYLDMKIKETHRINNLYIKDIYYFIAEKN